MRECAKGKAMEKTITLNETQVKLLREYRQAVTVEEAGKRCIQDALNRVDNASYDNACAAYDNAAKRVDIAARIFAASMSVDV
jgi:hypothetical protein